MQTDSPLARAPVDGPDEVGPPVEGAAGPSLNQRLVGIGVSHPYASQLASGQRTPSFELALRIERELGIPPSEWVERRRRFEVVATASGSAA